MIKAIMVTTIKRATNKGSLHIYVLRSIYNLVSVYMFEALNLQNMQWKTPNSAIVENIRVTKDSTMARFYC